MPNGPLLAVEAVIMGFLELKRFQGWKETGTSGFLNAFPFDPAGERGAGAGSCGLPSRGAESGCRVGRRMHDCPAVGRLQQWAVGQAQFAA